MDVRKCSLSKDGCGEVGVCKIATLRQARLIRGTIGSFVCKKHFSKISKGWETRCSLMHCITKKKLRQIPEVLWAAADKDANENCQLTDFICNTCYKMLSLTDPGGSRKRNRVSCTAMIGLINLR